MLVYPLPDPAGEAVLATGTQIVRLADDREATILAAIADADAIVLRGPAQLSATMIEGAPRLRVIGALGSGTDNIDVAAATRRGIPVVHGAGLAPRAVSEWVVGAMVACHRGFNRLDRAVRAGIDDWSVRPARYRATELTGTVVGIVGYGFIGRSVARVVQAAFDADVVVYDPLLTATDPTPTNHEVFGLVGAITPTNPKTYPVVGGVRRVDRLEELLDASMTVTVHVPLLPSTKGLFGEDELRRIGPGGVLLNASRGGVVDEAALVAVLCEGALKAAAVDVFADEPPTAEQVARLASAPNLLLSPHVAGITDQALSALSIGVAEGVLAVLRGARPDRLVNPEVLP